MRPYTCEAISVTGQVVYTGNGGGGSSFDVPPSILGQVPFAIKESLYAPSQALQRLGPDDKECER